MAFRGPPAPGVGGLHTSIDLSSLPSAPMKDIPLEDVLVAYKTDKNTGLSTASAERRLAVIGPNEIPRKKKSKIMRFLSFVLNPLSYVMESAALVAIVLANGEHLPPDWQDFVGIVFLLLLNATVGYYEESKAGDAVEALMASLSATAHVKRDSVFRELESRLLVPGDVVAVKLGDIVPADVKVVSCENVKADQAAMTGESLPVSKSPGDLLFSGTTIKQGHGEGIVVSTGGNTFFGKAAALVDQVDEMSHIQKVMTYIGSFCVLLILLFEVIIIAAMYAGFKYNYRRGIDNVLVLLIGGVPIAMPTVLSVTMSIGAHSLAKSKAIVTRITAIEEMAGMDILCSDKTGTLTKNKLEIAKDKTIVYGMRSIDDLLLLAGRAAALERQDAIDTAVVGMLGAPARAREGIDELYFMPFDPSNKRTEITYKQHSNGKTNRVSKGAPQVILELCRSSFPDPKSFEALKTKVETEINQLAESGYRAISVAECSVPDGTVREELPDAKWHYAGIIAIYDPPRDDSAETIKRALDLGVMVKMITGDQLAIGKETGRRLGMGTNMYESSIFDEKNAATIEATSGKELGVLLEEIDGVAGVLPEHKYTFVKLLQERGHLVGMTGDGVNDAPALKKADIGVAVSDACDAARGAADLVLTEPGLGVIVHAIENARCIFQRMKSYGLFATATTVRIVLSFSILILGWRYDQPPFLILILALLNDGTLITLSSDRAKASRNPDKWRLSELFVTAIALGMYLCLSTLIFFHLVYDTTFFDKHFSLESPWRLSRDPNEWTLHSIIYMQVSISGQALIFSTRSQSFWFMERPSNLLMIAFCLAQLAATLIGVYANWGFTHIRGAGWRWALTVWVWNLIWFIPMDIPKLLAKSLMNGEMWRSHREHALFSFRHGYQANRSRVPATGIAATRARASIGSYESAHRESITRVINSIDMATRPKIE
jgi:H+-transporting ATPase